MTKPKLYTTAEVAEIKGTTQRQVQRLAKAGMLPVHSIGPRNTQFFKASDVRYADMSLR